MSTKKAMKTVNKKKGAKKAKSGAAPVTESPDKPAEHWSNWSLDEVYVGMEGSRPVPMRRKRDKNGQLIELSKGKAAAGLGAIETEHMLANSNLSGEGNVDEDMWPRTKATLNLTLMALNLPDPIGGGRLEVRQAKFIKKIYYMCKRWLELLFDKAPENFDLPIKTAYDKARMRLCGKHNMSELQLAGKEKTDKALAEEVKELAREEFVKGAKDLPGRPEVNEDGSLTFPTVLYLHRKAYSHIKYDAQRDSRSKERGPTLSVLPSTLENWLEVQRQMHDLGRRYNPVYYVMPNGDPIPRPKRAVLVETVDAKTGETKNVKQKIEDPFWDPLDKIGKKKMATLVATKIYPRFKRGADSASNAYGVAFSFGPGITIIANQEKPPNVVVANEDYATGFQMPEGAFDDDDDADDTPEEVVVAKTEKEVKSGDKRKRDDEQADDDDEDEPIANGEGSVESPKKSAKVDSDEPEEGQVQIEEEEESGEEEEEESGEEEEEESD